MMRNPAGAPMYNCRMLRTEQKDGELLIVFQWLEGPRKGEKMRIGDPGEPRPTPGQTFHLEVPATLAD